jgi:hypothetical protein
MSDPVTNVEIEDVLSSIRRLVSEDARVRPVGWRADQGEAAVPQDAAAPEVVGRLVLTPALRVSDEAATEAVESAAADEVVPDAPFIDMDEQPEHERWEEASADVSYVAQEAEAVAVTEAPVPDADAEPEVLHHDGDQDVATDQTTGETEAYVLEASGDEAMVWEDHHEDSLPESDAPQMIEDAVQDAFYEDEDVLAAPVTDAPATAAREESEDGDFIFASTRDGLGRDTASRPAEPKYADDDALDDRAFLLAEDEAVLDEETLREMVAEIVRQELQGALGERITRNVRKLVRREIHRALTSHELE